MDPGVGHAQRGATANSKVAAARSYVDAGLHAQKQGDYDTAISLYWKAYALVPHPVLLFDIAQAHRLAGRVEYALTLYRKYLDEDPEGTEARRARELIAELEARMIEEARTDKKLQNPEQPREGDTSSPQATTRAQENARKTEDPYADEDTGHATGPAGREERVQAAVVNTAGREGATVQRREDHEGSPRSRPADEATPPPSVWVGVGPSIAQRQLSFDSTVAGEPVTHHFTAWAARLQGELYPFALLDRDSGADGLGLAVTYDSPVVRSDRAVKYSYYALGARYLFYLGATSALSVGLDYVRRQYLGFLPRWELGVPNVDYSLIVPSIAGRVPAVPSAALFVKLDALVATDAGEVSSPASYGSGDLYGFAATGGVEFALGKRFDLRFAIEYSRMVFQFDGSGDLASNTDGDRKTQEVRGATDRSIGFVVTVDLHY